MKIRCPSFPRSRTAGPRSRTLSGMVSDIGQISEIPGNLGQSRTLLVKLAFCCISLKLHCRGDVETLEHKFVIQNSVFCVSASFCCPVTCTLLSPSEISDPRFEIQIMNKIGTIEEIPTVRLRRRMSCTSRCFQISKQVNVEFCRRFTPLTVGKPRTSRTQCRTATKSSSKLIPRNRSIIFVGFLDQTTQPRFQM